MNQWISNHISVQKAALNSIPAKAVAKLIQKLREALQVAPQIFVLKNGGNAANASHFATDLGTDASIVVHQLRPTDSASLPQMRTLAPIV